MQKPGGYTYNIDINPGAEIFFIFQLVLNPHL